MDRIDSKILKCLRDNARQSATEISKEVNLSVAAVTERIRKLEAQNIIEKYTVVLRQKEMGNDIVALLAVSLEQIKQTDEFIGIISDMPEVAWCYNIAGEYDYVMQVCTQSTETLDKVYKKIKGIKGVNGSKVTLALKQEKNVGSVIPFEK